MSAELFDSKPPEERALLVGVTKKRETEWQTADSLAELAELASTAGAEIVGTRTFKQWDPHAGHFIGKGKMESLSEEVEANEITLVAFDDDLTPAQARNLEEGIGCRTIDRTQMILDIFALHAQTREGALQIDLAQHEYLLPRLRHMWTHLERQKGGIGLRGPGEQQLELDRRSIQAHIERLKRDLEKVRRHRGELRRSRRKKGWRTVSLVGYTNAGKSTLLNAMTDAEVKAEDQLFATLDPTTRRLELNLGSPVLLTDTVGFIRKLPHNLVESFKATLEEVQEADLLVHVIDASHPNMEQQIESVCTVLGELDAMNKPMMLVYNKMDRPEGKARALAGARGKDNAFAISAVSGEGLPDLKKAIGETVCGKIRRLQVHIPVTDGEILAWIRSHAAIHHEEYDNGQFMMLDISLPDSFMHRVEAYREVPHA